MHVQIGKYSIKTDQYQFILCKKVLVTKEGCKNFGQEVERNIGFYPKLSQIVEKIIHLELDEQDITTLKDIVSLVENIKEEVDKAGITLDTYKERFENNVK